MDEQYEIYCLVDRLFYDKPDNRTMEHPDFAVAGQPLPEGWEHQATDTWLHYAPVDVDLPAQGWKIHVSARLNDAERALQTVWDYCVPREIPFKFLRSRAVVTMVNSKAAARGSSGKLVTIYPRESDLELVLKELDDLLRGIEGPYVLSDLRYGGGPLFVRYGGFVPRYCTAENGESVPAIEDADGRLVPDVRGPAFSVPAWMSLPEFLEPHLAARNAVTTEGLDYTVESVLHFSNGGGVYLARDRRTDERVVLKEARPYAGLDAAGRDAVARLWHEREMLQRLQGLDGVPGYRDHFTLGEHHFLVMEFVDGNPLQRQLVHRYPLTRADCTEQDLAEYTAWVLETLPKVHALVESVHARGVVFGDLHPSNILVTGTGRMVLIDFEVAMPVEERGRSKLAHPAFLAPPDREGVEIDRYALACLCFGFFAPQATITLLLDREKITQLADMITRTFPVPHEIIAEATRTIRGTAEPVDPPDWPSGPEALTRAILASATPSRDDRLFPGDIAQFRPGGGLNFAHGAAGVLYALDAAGAGRHPAYEEWLLRQAGQTTGIPPGFYDGLHGIAHVLHGFGHTAQALNLVDAARHLRWDPRDLSLYSGLSGIGLTYLDLGLDADEIIQTCVDRLPAEVPELSGGDNPRTGLMYGSSGPALLFLHAYEHTGDPALLDLAERALRQDLRRCIRTGDGSLQVNQGWRTLPYLEEGSAGIALVLERLLKHRPDPELQKDLEALRLVTRSRFFVQPGLFNGRAGLILAARADRELVAGLDWHALPYGKDGLAFPGDQLLRLSMDFATGTAGVLFALSAAPLPFLRPPGDHTGPGAPLSPGAERHPHPRADGGGDK
ncbi:class III lanthionine synthetase LanKC [Acrocarpospora catenulata]|uniref:class III lanthionine synthetase LanKC n=1 Tax=Acrocarpospora catenulata TaxID=2836182 RepID=UPI001BDB0F4F|nr:class III lanthionine synthetase LanKC [Acrocarpospora catenulata]